MRSLPPVIAIHGVGNHEPDDIRNHLNSAFGRADLSAEVDEFNWDAFVDHSVKRVTDALQLLGTTAASISQAAALPFPPGTARAARLLFGAEEVVYHGILRPMVAVGLTALIAGPLLYLLATIPAAIFGGAPWQELSWVAPAARTAAVVIALAVAAQLAIGALRTIATFSPHPFAVAVRRVLLLLLQPVFLLLTVPVSMKFGSGLATFVGSMLPLSLIGSVLALAVSPLTGDVAGTASDIGLSILMLAALGTVAGVHVLLRRLWVGTLLKVILDIVRYVGSPKYRMELQAALDAKIRSLGEQQRIDATGTDDSGRRFVLYAHSLGSVIALDSLINSPVWQTNDEVELVTLGSPIGRSFMRFFAGYLFPPTIGDAAAAAARRLHRFTWINVHRRWDYVGTSLGLGRAGVGLDICTGQGSRILSAHSNYWDDDVVVRAFKNSRERVEPVAPAGGKQSPSAHRIPAVHRSPLLERIAGLAGGFAWAAAATVIGLAVLNFFESRDAWLRSIEQDIEALQQYGEEALAAVTYHRTTEGSGREQYFLHHYVIHLPEPHGELEPIEIPDNVLYDDNARRFDYHALADFVLEDCEREERKRWWQIFRTSKSIPCTRVGIPIRFDAADPTSFWLPGFVPTTTFWDYVIEAFGSLIMAGLLATGCFVALYFGIVPLFRLFLGLEG